MRNHFFHFCIASGLNFSTFGLTFSVLGGSLGPPWGTLGPRPLKTSKRSLFGTSFRGQFLTCFSFFGGDVFHVFSKPLYFHLVPQLGCNLVPFWETFSNISDVCGVFLGCTPSRAKTYIFTFWSYLVEPVCLFFSMTVLGSDFYVFSSHSSKYGYPFGIHSGLEFTIISTSFSDHFYVKRCVSKWNPAKGICGTS